MLASWLETYGLWFVLIGSILEGEGVMLAAGFAISQGYLPAAPVFALAVLGATLGDHAYFLIGRRWVGRVLRRFARLRRLRARATLLLRRWGRAGAFAIRFAYGLRSVLPLTMGSVRFPVSLFLPFNLLGAVVFAGVYLSLGYFFGETLEEVLHRVRGWETRVLAGILLFGALAWAVREWQLSRAVSGNGTEDDPGVEG